MADISKISDVAWDSAAKVGGASKDSIAKFGGVDVL